MIERMKFSTTASCPRKYDVWTGIIRLFHPFSPPHFTTPVRVLALSGPVGAKENSWQSPADPWSLALGLPIPGI
jgi:hypothetical protein